MSTRENEPLTVERIFGQGKEFKNEEWGPAHWLEDGSAYTTLEVSADFNGSKDIVRYACSSGDREIIVRAADLIPPGHTTPLAIHSYALSGSSDRILIFTNTKKVWRHETCGDYWVLDRKTLVLKQLGGQAQPSTLMFATFSPTGDRVAYVCRNNLFVQSLEDFQITELTSDGSATIINGTADWVNEEEFHLRNGLRWSPDGESIAYWQFDTAGVREFQLIDNTTDLYPSVASYAYPKVGGTNSACRVGVVKAVGGPTRWFQSNTDPRNHYIPKMEWATDSRRVIFQQLNRLQNTNQIICGDPASGAVTVLLTERDDAWLDVMNGWHWIEEGTRFLWLSERDGWQHLYSVSMADGSLQLLTPGEYDVLGIAGVDEKAACAYFIASPENATQRYLYRVPLDGSGGAVRVSPPDLQGTHVYNISDDGRWGFHTFSSFNQPPVIDLVHLPDHTSVRILAANSALRDKLAALSPCPHEIFQVDIGGAVLLDAWCLKPPDFNPARLYPLLVYVYGEPAGTTVKDAWGGANHLWHSFLAQQGYVVMSIDNRGTPSPKGRAWRKSIYRQIGILAAADQAAATREILRTRPYLDPARVGIWGHSGGGSMSLHAIFREPGLYHTAMALSFVANQRFYDTIYQERYMGLPDENEPGYTDGSPITHAHRLQGNLLLVYGTGDDNCHYQNCEVLVDELIKHNKRFSMMSYPNRSHSIDEGENTKRHLYETLTRYLADHLPVTSFPSAS